VEPGDAAGRQDAIPEAAAVYHTGKRLVIRVVLSGYVAPGRESGPRMAPPIMVSYKEILERADAFFRQVADTQPQNLQCGRGCSLCCYGLFEIGAADIPVLADGLKRLHPMRRRMIVRRAAEVIASTKHPNLRERTAAEKAAFLNGTASIPCPNLDDTGACMVYEQRPLVCRTFGLPLREGDRYIGDVCELNFTGVSDQERLTAAWDLNWEDTLDPEEEYTIPEAIVLIARLHGWV
jgi:Fe-S-cluster containining protein